MDLKVSKKHGLNPSLDTCFYGLANKHEEGR